MHKWRHDTSDSFLTKLLGKESTHQDHSYSGKRFRRVLVGVPRS